jgi:hypothetical protein
MLLPLDLQIGLEDHYIIIASRGLPGYEVDDHHKFRTNQYKPQQQ